MKRYIAKQLRLIHLYAQQLHVDDETAARLWIDTGLATRFNKLKARR